VLKSSLEEELAARRLVEERCLRAEMDVREGVIRNKANEIQLLAQMKAASEALELKEKQLSETSAQLAVMQRSFDSAQELLQSKLASEETQNRINAALISELQLDVTFQRKKIATSKLPF
jgi:gas vesicle protein